MWLDAVSLYLRGYRLDLYVLVPREAWLIRLLLQCVTVLAMCIPLLDWRDRSNVYVIISMERESLWLPNADVQSIVKGMVLVQ